MIKSPGSAASIAAWIESDGATCFGVLPPIVTVTVSIDCLPWKVWMGEAAAVPVARTHVVVLIVQDGTVKVTVGLPV
jgi:hypothetical protein